MGKELVWFYCHKCTKKTQQFPNVEVWCNNIMHAYTQMSQDKPKPPPEPVNVLDRKLVPPTPTEG